MSSDGALQEMVNDIALQVARDSSQDTFTGVRADGTGRFVHDSTATLARTTSEVELKHYRQGYYHALPGNDMEVEDCIVVKQPSKPFPIMDLPTEIRLEIYRACLTRPYHILLSKREARTRRRRARAQHDAGQEENGEDSDGESSVDSEDSEEDLHLNTHSRQRTCLQPTVPPTSFASFRRGTITASLRGLASRGTNPIRRFAHRSSFSSSSANPANGAVHPPSHAHTNPHQSLPSTDAHFHLVNSRRPRAITASHARIVSFAPPSNPSQNDDPLLVNLLCASKDIYKEARGVLYSENVLKLDINTATSTLACLHQRSRRQIKHIELEIPTYNEILERFQETVRLSLRYCSGLKKFVIHMPFTLPGADGSGRRGNAMVYANGFDILRWLPQECDVILKGNIGVEIKAVVDRHLHLAKTLDKVSSAGVFDFDFLVLSGFRQDRSSNLPC